MFKGFSSSVKPKKKETESWEELFVVPRTGKHLRDVDDCSSKSGSYFGSTHNRPTVPDRRHDDAADELEQLKIAEHKAGDAAQAAADCCTTHRPYRCLDEINDGFGGWGKKVTVKELQNGIVPHGGAFTGFGTSGALQLPTRPASSGMFHSAKKDSMRDTSPVAVEQKSTVASLPENGFKSSVAAKTSVVLPGNSGFSGFGSIKSALSPIPTPDATGRVQVNFGTLHVSGPAAAIAALKERSEKMEKIEANEGTKKVRVEDVGEAKAAVDERFSLPFGSIKGASVSPIPAPDATGRVQVDFGTLHVSGPAAKIAALKEKERNGIMEKRDAKEGSK